MGGGVYDALKSIWWTTRCFPRWRRLERWVRALAYDLSAYQRQFVDGESLSRYMLRDDNLPNWLCASLYPLYEIAEQFEWFRSPK